MDTETVNHWFKVAISHNLIPSEANKWSADAYASAAPFETIRLRLRVREGGTSHILDRTVLVKEVCQYRNGKIDFICLVTDAMVDEMRVKLRSYRRAKRPIRAA